MVLESDEAERFDGFVLLGCVIRGETGHYDIVANESARAVMDLTVDMAWPSERHPDRREWRSGLGEGPRFEKNKGAAAAAAAYDMMLVRQQLERAGG
jgi:6,7-dimethyl-8-ribityllumazine synthase